MSLFDDSIDRSGTEAAAYLEPNYTYLNRSGRDRFANARDEMDTWFTAYQETCPDEARRLKQDFTSQSDLRHLSAFTELYTHHLLVTAGYEVECHPTVPDSTNHPEFLVKQDGQGVFYVECKALVGAPDTVRNEQWKREILDAINEINSPDFFVSMEIKKVDQNNPPRSGRLRDFLQRQIDGLDYDEVCRVYEETEKQPTFNWETNDWDIEFLISPVSDEGRRVRDQNSGVVGSYTTGVHWIGLHEQIGKAIERKATHYGNLGLPYLIVLNVIEDHTYLDMRTMMDALFGQEQMRIQAFVEGPEKIEYGRTLKGAFVTPSGPKNTRVSGVLVLAGARAWHHEVEHTVWLHPAASRPFDKAWLGLPYMIHNDAEGRMEKYPPEESGVAD